MPKVPRDRRNPPPKRPGQPRRAADPRTHHFRQQGSCDREPKQVNEAVGIAGWRCDERRDGRSFRRRNQRVRVQILDAPTPWKATPGRALAACGSILRNLRAARSSIARREGCWLHRPEKSLDRLEGTIRNSAFRCGRDPKDGGRRVQDFHQPIGHPDSRAASRKTGIRRWTSHPIPNTANTRSGCPPQIRRRATDGCMKWPSIATEAVGSSACVRTTRHAHAFPGPRPLYASSMILRQTASRPGHDSLYRDRSDFHGRVSSHGRLRPFLRIAEIYFFRSRPISGLRRD